MKPFLQVLLLSLAVLAGGASGQTIQQAKASAEQDLRSAIRELGQLRAKIEGEKIPLAKKVAELEREAAGKRRELDRKLRLRDNRDASLIQLKEEVRENESQLDQSLRLLQDYARSWRQSSPPAEQELWKTPIADALKKAGKEEQADLEPTCRSLPSLPRQSGNIPAV